MEEHICNSSPASVISKAMGIPEYLTIELWEEWKSSLAQLIHADNTEEFIHSYYPAMLCQNSSQK